MCHRFLEIGVLNLQRELQFSDTKQVEEVMAKRTAKNSVFLDLFQNKSYLLKLYKSSTRRTPQRQRIRLQM